MSRIPPVPDRQLTEAQREIVAAAEQLMGFVSNDTLVMARNPALTRAFGQLVAAIYAPGKVDAGLKRLIGLVTSSAAGCTYCMGHTAYASGRQGVDDTKIEAVWSFEQSELFSAAEKAALRVALHAGQVPNGVTDTLYDELASHYDEEAQLEIISVIALFGFLNRWNSTLHTQLESLPQNALRTSRRRIEE